MRRGANNRNERAQNKKEWGKLESPGGSRKQAAEQDNTGR
jgi:hypothetical protein